MVLMSGIEIIDVRWGIRTRDHRVRQQSVVCRGATCINHQLSLERSNPWSGYSMKQKRDILVVMCRHRCCRTCRVMWLSERVTMTTVGRNLFHFVAHWKRRDPMSACRVDLILRDRWTGVSSILIGVVEERMGQQDEYRTACRYSVEWPVFDREVPVAVTKRRGDDAGEIVPVAGWEAIASFLFETRRTTTTFEGWWWSWWSR